MDIHPAFAAEFAAEAKRLRGKYTAPLHLGVDNPPDWANDPMTTDAFAWTINKGRFPVTLNPRWFGPDATPAKTRKEFAEMTKNYRSVELSIPNVLTHEYGHVLTDHLPMWRWTRFAKDLQEYLRNAAMVARNERQFFSALSQYGMSDPGEAMAEAFVLMDRGTDHPAGQIAEKYLGKFRR